MMTFDLACVGPVVMIAQFMLLLRPAELFYI